jgi:hypothetical protein
MSYDVKCYQLAEGFLGDEEANGFPPVPKSEWEFRAGAIAQAIQNTIEDELEFQRNRARLVAEVMAETDAGAVPNPTADWPEIPHLKPITATVRKFTAPELVDKG